MHTGNGTREQQNRRAPYPNAGHRWWRNSGSLSCRRITGAGALSPMAQRNCRDARTAAVRGGAASRRCAPW